MHGIVVVVGLLALIVGRGDNVRKVVCFIKSVPQLNLVGPNYLFVEPANQCTNHTNIIMDLINQNGQTLLESVTKTKL